MAITVTGGMNARLLDVLFGRNGKKSGKGSQKNYLNNLFPLSSGIDRFNSTSADQIIKLTVQKMQSAISGTFGGVAGQIQIRSGSLSLNTLTQAEIPEPTQWQIDQAVERAGGMDALSPWLVDGKTKLDINGRKTVVDVTGGGSTEAASESGGDPRLRAAASLARFGVDESKLDGDLGALRQELKDSATVLRHQNPNLAHAIEYALEDAFAAIGAWEQSKTGAAAPMDGVENQAEINRGQADSIVRQLNLGEGDAWGVRSMAEDLAVFGMDMTALSGDVRKTADQIRTKSQEMLKDLEQRYAGTETEFIAARNRITGAASRLINGMEGASVMSGASASLTGSFASTKVSVSVGGVQLDANTVIAVGNVIVDPLVFDLNGDGIDLKSAEEGVLFDMNGNGEQNRTGFIRGDDALLFVDTHGDGVVHDGRQLFGNTQGHANGFEMLAAYDDNGDGVIDENDAIYDQLRLWVEKNEDGVCEQDETMSLREAGIKSINLGYQNVREDDGKGNLIGQTGSFTRDDGSEGYAADVWLQEKKA